MKLNGTFRQEGGKANPVLDVSGGTFGQILIKLTSCCEWHTGYSYSVDPGFLSRILKSESKTSTGKSRCTDVATEMVRVSIFRFIEVFSTFQKRYLQLSGILSIMFISSRNACH